MRGGDEEENERLLKASGTGQEAAPSELRRPESPRPSRPYKLMRKASTMITDPASNIDIVGVRERRRTESGLTDAPELVLGPVDVPFQGIEEEEGASGWIAGSYSKFKALLGDPKIQAVLKCSLAYFVSSLGVYTPFGRLYGQSDNKHMIATIAVYFHPSRTSGSMAEAILYVVFALGYSFLLSVLSMVVSAFFFDIDQRGLGYIIIIIVFVGGGLGSILYMKTRMNRVTFNTACSVASISLVTILIKEGSVQAGQLSYTKLYQNFAIVTTGIIVSMVICYTVWPKSAVIELKKALNKSMDIDATMLQYVVDQFITSGEINNEHFEELTAELSSSFKSLQSNLADSRFELYISGREREFHLLRKLVASTHRLSAHVGGLVSSAKTQWYLSEPSGDSRTASDVVSVESADHVLSRVSSQIGISDNYQSTSDETEAEHDTQSYSAELYNIFINHLGPPMRGYCFTLRDILSNVPFSPFPALQFADNRRLKDDLVYATMDYSRSRQDALSTVYGQSNFRNTRDINVAADEEGVAASCGNFSYVLEAYGKELRDYIEILEDYENLQLRNLSRTYEWLKFWEKKEPEEEVRTFDVMTLRQQTFYTPKPSSDAHQRAHRWSYKLWKSLGVFRQTDVKFAIKVGLGAAVYAIPAFLDHLRPLFGRWRGEWGLITYAIIMSKSIGGTMTTVKIRIFGTFVGALTAYLIWAAFPRNPVALSIFGWMLSLPCFWIILHWKSDNPLGRFILLTFNLTVLYSYSLSINDYDDDDDEGGTTPLVGDIAFHRFVSVSFGTLWAVLITMFVFPNSARRRLRDLVAVQWLRMGISWKADPLRNEGSKGIIGLKGELDFQSTMIELYTLLSQAPREVRLKGPYPSRQYKSILLSTQHILDAYQNLSVMVAKNKKPTKREAEIIQYTEDDRKELCSRIFLFFYLVSSAIKIGFPLPDKLPSTEHAIDRMLAKLNEFRVNEDLHRDLSHDEEDFVLFYSYILVTLTITEELSKIALEIQDLFGIIDEEALQVE
ncbi:hypothetical protein TRVA0_048S00474 [Trichomonascus vanleenenianus]|uniref:FUSC family protein n=1 Tax=Trichomonascus vanleenenianus TaxID=2268995 RepID=UPI003EC9EC55